MSVQCTTTQQVHVADTILEGPVYNFRTVKTNLPLALVINKINGAYQEYVDRGNPSICSRHIHNPYTQGAITNIRINSERYAIPQNLAKRLYDEFKTRNPVDPYAGNPMYR